jgi:RimJ/RimL family protein N-acetyltransferase
MGRHLPFLFLLGEVETPMQEIVKTERLTLRHFRAADAARVQALCNNWNIARMLSRMPYPYSETQAAAWIASHDDARSAGREFPLAIEWEGQLVGSTGMLVHENGDHEIGYWIGEPYWNRGFATEAGRAVVDLAVRRASERAVVAGHHADNHASGRVLTKLGFRYTGEDRRWCEARREEVRCLSMKLARGIAK